MKCDFFEEQTEVSATKTEIVTKYLEAWGSVIALRAGDRFVYFEPFAGPGLYDNGAKGTPIIVLESAIAHKGLRTKLIPIFGDADAGFCGQLRANIRAIPGIRELSHAPVVYLQEVDERLGAHLAETSLVPTLAFLDPCGFKGVSLQLVNSLVKDWGCDCLFFFNYNQVNRWLTAGNVSEHIDLIFGAERASRLRVGTSGVQPEAREILVMGMLNEALLEGPAKHVQMFRFRNQDGSRTSHYLVFVSKAFKGYEIMRDIMGGYSSYLIGSVPSYTHTPKTPDPKLEDSLVIARLEADLLREFGDRQLTVREVFEAHSPGEPFLLRNYQEALRSLEERGCVQMDPPASKRRPRNGIRTLAVGTKVTFPKC